MKTFLPVLMLCAAMHSGFAQAEVIELANPSFEDTPSSSFTPKFWRNCGFAEESPPDIQPGTMTVTQPAHDGKTYLGMVVRDNNNILEGLQQHPNLTLIIAILEIDTELANRKKQSLMEVLSEYGDLEHQITIKRWGAGDENHFWYGAEEKYSHVLMR